MRRPAAPAREAENLPGPPWATPWEGRARRNDPLRPPRGLPQPYPRSRRFECAPIDDRRRGVIRSDPSGPPLASIGIAPTGSAETPPMYPSHPRVFDAHPRLRPAGFTLIELLVVISVIA